MTKENEFSIGTNNSSILTAPTRSEIRFSFSVDYPTLFANAKRLLRLVVFITTFLIMCVFWFCTVFELSLPRTLTVVMMVTGIFGVLYGTHCVFSSIYEED